MENMHAAGRIVRKTSRSGFTLVELLLVVTILGILAGVVFMNFGNVGQDTRISATRTSIGSVCNAVRVFEMHVGRFPDSIDDLTNPINDRAPLLKKEGLADAWGNAFQYKKSGQTFEVRSAGPDAQMGTEDDLTN